VLTLPLWKGSGRLLLPGRARRRRGAASRARIGRLNVKADSLISHSLQGKEEALVSLPSFRMPFPAVGCTADLPSASLQRWNAHLRCRERLQSLALVQSSLTTSFTRSSTRFDFSAIAEFAPCFELTSLLTAKQKTTAELKLKKPNQTAGERREEMLRLGRVSPRPAARG
jgi:hypothetical protein